MDGWDSYCRTIRKNRNITYDCFRECEILDTPEKWVGGVYFRGCIYGITNSSRNCVCIDPIKKTYGYFGKTKIGTFKWTGGCVYHERIYGFPRKENSLLVIDPDRNELYTQSLDTHYHGEHHYGGVCTEEGIIYQPPRNCDHILKINLCSFETGKILVTENDAVCRYCGSVLLPDGDIWMIPENGYRLLLFHPKTETVEHIGMPIPALVFGPVVGEDGNIYGFCKDGNGLLKIDTKRRKPEMICQEIGNPGCYGSVVGVNGDIFGIPANGNGIWRFCVESQRAEKIFDLSEAKCEAKCAGAGVGTDGTICMIPAFGNKLIFLGSSARIQIEEASIQSQYLNTFY